MTDVAAALCPEAFAAAPDKAITVECEIVRVLDGDTIEVAVRQRYRVRLLDCWAAETRGDSKAAGLSAKQHLQSLLDSHGCRGVLSVPCGEDVGKAWSMGRVLGNVWINGQDKSLSEIQVESGHATKVKQ